MIFQPDLDVLRALTKRIRFARSVRLERPIGMRIYDGSPYPLPDSKNLFIYNVVSNANFLVAFPDESFESEDYLWEAYVHTLLGRGIERHFGSTVEKITDNGYIVDLLLTVDKHLLCDYSKL